MCFEWWWVSSGYFAPTSTFKRHTVLLSAYLLKIKDSWVSHLLYIVHSLSSSVVFCLFFIIVALLVYLFVCVYPVTKGKLSSYNLAEMIRFGHTIGSLLSLWHFLIVFIIEVVLYHSSCTVSVLITVEIFLSLCRYSHSVLWHCWLTIRKNIQLVKIECWGVSMVFYPERGADCLHMVWLMPLPS